MAAKKLGLAPRPCVVEAGTEQNGRLTTTDYVLPNERVVVQGRQADWVGLVPAGAVWADIGHARLPSNMLIHTQVNGNCSYSD